MFTPGKYFKRVARPYAQEKIEKKTIVINTYKNLNVYKLDKFSQNEKDTDNSKRDNSYSCFA